MSEKNKDHFFSKEKQEKATKWLNDKLQNKKCECCGDNTWHVADFLVAPPRFESGTILGGKVMPQVAIICNNCGNTKYFNAIKMGIIDGEK